MGIVLTDDAFAARRHLTSNADGWIGPEPNTDERGEREKEWGRGWRLWRKGSVGRSLRKPGPHFKPSPESRPSPLLLPPSKHLNQVGSEGGFWFGGTTTEAAAAAVEWGHEEGGIFHPVTESRRSPELHTAEDIMETGGGLSLSPSLSLSLSLHKSQMFCSSVFSLCVWCGPCRCIFAFPIANMRYLKSSSRVGNLVELSEKE